MFICTSHSWALGQLRDKEKAPQIQMVVIDSAVN